MRAPSPYLRIRIGVVGCYRMEGRGRIEGRREGRRSWWVCFGVRVGSSGTSFSNCTFAFLVVVFVAGLVWVWCDGGPLEALSTCVHAIILSE